MEIPSEKLWNEVMKFVRSRFWDLSESQGSFYKAFRETVLLKWRMHSKCPELPLSSSSSPEIPPGLCSGWAIRISPARPRDTCLPAVSLLSPLSLGGKPSFQAMLCFPPHSRNSGDWGNDGFEIRGTRESFVLKDHENCQRKGGHCTECHSGKGPMG